MARHPCHPRRPGAGPCGGTGMVGGVLEKEMTDCQNGRHWSSRASPPLARDSVFISLRQRATYAIRDHDTRRARVSFCAAIFPHRFSAGRGSVPERTTATVVRRSPDGWGIFFAWLVGVWLLLF